jgi:hypothetical protein
MTDKKGNNRPSPIIGPANPGRRTDKIGFISGMGGSWILDQVEERNIWCSNSRSSLAKGHHVIWDDLGFGEGERRGERTRIEEGDRAYTTAETRGPRRRCSSRASRLLMWRLLETER